MDPNANLREQREIVTQINRLRDTGGDADHLVWRLAELVEALDQWIMGGGFLPDAWALRHHDK